MFERLPNGLLLPIFPLLFAIGIFLNKGLLTVLSPNTLIGVRMLFGGLFLLLININNYRKPRKRAHLAQDAKIFLAIMLFTTYIPTLLKAFALKYMLSSKASFLGSIDPFVTAFYTYLFWGEQLNRYKWLGIILGTAGTILLLATHTPLEDTLSSLSIISLPEVAALLSMSIGRLGWMFVQKQIRTNRYSPSEVNGIVMTGAGFLALMTAWYRGELVVLTTITNPLIWAGLAGTITVGNLLAYNLFTYLLKKNSATLLSVTGTSIPVCVSLLGYLFYSEPLSSQLFIAAGFIILGTFVFYSHELRRKKPTPPSDL